MEKAKMIKFFLSLILITSSYGVTLQEAYEAAVKRSETVAIQGEQINQAESQYKEALGSVLPQISGVAYYTHYGPDLPKGYSNYDKGAKLTASQSIFQGFREFATLRALSAGTRAEEAAKEDALIQLHNDVTQNFFSILSLEKDLQNTQTQVAYSEERIKELKSRFNIGRSRESEVLTVDASLSSLRAQLRQISSQINANREALAFLTGLSKDSSLTDQEVQKSVGDVSDFLKKVDQRPEIKAAKERQKSTDENVTSAWGAHLPSLSLTGNYYFVRSGTLENSKWDATINLSVPLFEGGSIQGRVNEAKSQNIQAELQVTKLKRQAEQEIKTLFENYKSDLDQISEFKKASELAERNYKLQHREYLSGLVTNLDVLQALTSLQDNMRAYDRAKYSAKIDYIKLQNATGTITKTN